MHARQLTRAARAAPPPERDRPPASARGGPIARPSPARLARSAERCLPESRMHRHGMSSVSGRIGTSMCANALLLRSRPRSAERHLECQSRDGTAPISCAICPGLARFVLCSHGRRSGRRRAPRRGNGPTPPPYSGLMVLAGTKPAPRGVRTCIQSVPSMGKAWSMTTFVPMGSRATDGRPAPDQAAAAHPPAPRHDRVARWSPVAGWALALTVAGAARWSPRYPSRDHHAMTPAAEVTGSLATAANAAALARPRERQQTSGRRAPSRRGCRCQRQAATRRSAAMLLHHSRQ